MMKFWVNEQPIIVMLLESESRKVFMNNDLFIFLKSWVKTNIFFNKINWISEFWRIKFDWDKESKVESWKRDVAWKEAFLKEILPNVEIINLNFTMKVIFDLWKEMDVVEKVFCIRQLTTHGDCVLAKVMLQS